VKSRRNLFDELIAGVDAMRDSRLGKITLRTHVVEDLENWEQGRSEPNAQAAALILMVGAFPDTLDRLSTLGKAQS
jgi:putative transcriptional regulator